MGHPFPAGTGGGDRRAEGDDGIPRARGSPRPERQMVPPARPQDGEDRDDLPRSCHPDPARRARGRQTRLRDDPAAAIGADPGSRLTRAPLRGTARSPPGVPVRGGHAERTQPQPPAPPPHGVLLKAPAHAPGGARTGQVTLPLATVPQTLSFSLFARTKLAVSQAAMEPRTHAEHVRTCCERQHA